jgi:osmotically-inducible protein OsmY
MCRIERNRVALSSYITLRVFRYPISFAGRILALRNMETHKMKNDTQIQQEVVAELEQDESLPAGSIGVEVHHGVVKLAGRISDAETKKRAALNARRVEGVTGIILDLGIERR